MEESNKIIYTKSPSHLPILDRHIQLLSVLLSVWKIPCSLDNVKKGGEVKIVRKWREAKLPDHLLLRLLSQGKSEQLLRKEITPIYQHGWLSLGRNRSNHGILL